MVVNAFYCNRSDPFYNMDDVDDETFESKFDSVVAVIGDRGKSTGASAQVRACVK